MMEWGYTFNFFFGMGTGIVIGWIWAWCVNNLYLAPPKEESQQVRMMRQYSEMKAKNPSECSETRENTL